jgi:hypothetical protein
MTEDEYYAGKFTDVEPDCQADIADYRRAVEEFFFEHRQSFNSQASRLHSLSWEPLEALRSHLAKVSLRL